MKKSFAFTLLLAALSFSTIAEAAKFLPVSDPSQLNTENKIIFAAQSSSSLCVLKSASSAPYFTTCNGYNSNPFYWSTDDGSLNVDVNTMVDYIFTVSPADADGYVEILGTHGYLGGQISTSRTDATLVFTDKSASSTNFKWCIPTTTDSKRITLFRNDQYDTYNYLYISKSGYSNPGNVQITNSTNAKNGWSYDWIAYRQVCILTLNPRDGYCEQESLSGMGMVSLPPAKPIADMNKYFIGWSTDGTKANIVSSSYNLTEDQTLYAVYETLAETGVYMMATEPSDLQNAYQIIIAYKEGEDWYTVTCGESYNDLQGWVRCDKPIDVKQDNTIVDPATKYIFTIIGQDSYLYSPLVCGYFEKKQSNGCWTNPYPKENNADNVRRWHLPTSVDGAPLYCLKGTWSSHQDVVAWIRNTMSGMSEVVQVDKYDPTKEWTNLKYYTFVRKEPSTITFDLGKGATTTIEPVSSITSFNLPSVSTKEGYIHSGWRDENNGAVYGVNDEYTPKGDATLTALYNSNIVIYNPGEGTIVGSLSEETAHVDALPACTPLSGKRFLGWSLTENDTEYAYKSGEPFDVNGIVRLFAIYGEIAEGYNFSRITSITDFGSGDVIVSVLEDGKDGTHIYGIDLNTTGSGKYNPQGDVIVGPGAINKTLNEIFLNSDDSYDYMFYITNGENDGGILRDGKGSVKDAYYSSYAGLACGTMSNQYAWLTAKVDATVSGPDRWHFEETGDGHFYIKQAQNSVWCYLAYYDTYIRAMSENFYSSNGKKPYNQHALQRNVQQGDGAWTIYKRYEGTIYRVRYVMGNGALTGADEEFGVVVTLPQASKVTAPIGYQLAGWATTAEKAAAGTVEYEPGFAYHPSSDVFLYAVYTPIIYTYTYETDETKSEAVAAQTGSIISPITMPNVTMTDDQYAFVGWAETENGEVVYTAGQEVTPTANLTLYAIYKQLGNIQVGDNYYDTFEDAIAAGNELKLIFDVTEDLTIADGKDITLNGNGKKISGDITIEKGGKLTITGATTCDDLYLASTKGKSSQLAGHDKLTISSDAFVDIDLVEAAAISSSKWYGFAVPFEVRATDGLYRTTGDIIDKDAYWIAQYDGNQRAQTSDGWVYPFEGTLTPGNFYMITSDVTDKTLRLKKSGDFAENGVLTLNAYNTTSVIADQGWNALANPLTEYATTSTTAVTLAQVYNNNNNAYEVVTLADHAYVMGTPFFVQSGEGSITMAAGDKTPRYAPAYEQEQLLYCVDFGAQEDSWKDHLYLTASNDATNDYQIGRDLGKMRSTSVPQIWANAYGYTLCAQDAQWNGGDVAYFISLYAPQNGTYVLSLSKLAENEVYLYRNGEVVWNLTDGDITLNLKKGTHEEFYIVISGAKAPTSTNTLDNKKQVNKWFVNGILYLNANGQVYSAQGEKIK